MTAQKVSMGRCRWRFRRCWLTTLPAPWPPPRIFTSARGNLTCSSRSPGTKEGLPAIEEAIFAGVPINVTLLFSREQYLAAADAYLRGVERRIDAGFKPAASWRIAAPNCSPARIAALSLGTPPWTAAEGYATCCPAEKSGQDEFDFEYGDQFDEHIEAIHSTFCKVLVRYNPEGNQSLNQRQLFRLRRLSEYLHSNLGHSRFMFELLVPPEKAQLDRLKGDKWAYDLELRPGLMAQAIHQLQDAEIEPDVWKGEGLERHEDCEKIVAAARWQTRHNVGCIIPGRGEDDGKVREWLTTAAAVPGFIDFAVGRTTFWDPLVEWRAKKIPRSDSVAAIARRYREFVEIFETREKAVPA
jgi:myo-inositol catabolism protein IolC